MNSNDPTDPNSQRNSPEDNYAKQQAAGMASRVNSMVGQGADREPKAVVLMDRIYRMESVINRLCTLRDRIQQGNIPLITGAEPKRDSLAPTISSVLNEGPEILQVQFNQMNDIIEGIELELF